MNNLEQLICPELFVMIPVLNFAASWMKRDLSTADTQIPARLGGIAIFLSLCYEFSKAPVTDLAGLCGIAFSGVTQGLLCASAAVYLHQLKHQKEKADKQESSPPAEAKPAQKPKAGKPGKKP